MTLMLPPGARVAGKAPPSTVKLLLEVLSSATFNVNALGFFMDT